jgi:hypothetical protein
LVFLTKKSKIMKKLLILAAVGLTVASGCKKDFTCTCTIDGTDIPYTWTEIDKSDAQDACDALDAAASAVDPADGCDLD